jgi:hypothetical protein
VGGFSRNQQPAFAAPHTTRLREWTVLDKARHSAVGSVYRASLDIVAWLTLNRRARSACVAAPSASAERASRRWCFVSFGGLPM